VENRKGYIFSSLTKGNLFLTKVHAIRKEFDEPFKDVIHWFARMGYSKKMTSEILEINRDYFWRTLLPRYAPNAEWKPQVDMKSDCKPHGKGWPKGKERLKPQKYSDQELLSEVLKYDTAERFDNMAIPSVSTVIKRFGSWNRAKRLAKIA